MLVERFSQSFERRSAQRGCFRQQSAPNNGDKRLMLFAVSSAMDGIMSGSGGPFGCAIVRNKQIVATSCNTALLTDDCTCHAEMNCIQAACRVLNTCDLSECELCPMCWGAATRAGIRRVIIGVGADTAIAFGFNDLRFPKKAHVKKTLRTLKPEEQLLRDDLRQILASAMARYRRRRLAAVHTKEERHGLDASDATTTTQETTTPRSTSSHRMTHLTWMNETASTTTAAATQEHPALNSDASSEAFGAVIVKNGNVIATGCHTTTCDKDPTATAEMNAIRKATTVLGTPLLEDCHLYAMAEPDLMSLGAIYAAHIATLHIGMSQTQAAQFGCDDSWTQYRGLHPPEEKHVVPTVKDVCVDECRALFEMWNTQRRQRDVSTL